MAQQDIRYYLNGMLLVDRQGLACRRSPPTGTGLSYASLAVRGRLFAPGGDPAAQDRARARQAARGQRRRMSRSTILANQVRFRFSNIELVSKVVDGKFPDYNRVIPSGHSKQPRPVAHRAAAGAAARGDPLERKVSRCAPGARAADQLQDHLHQQRAGGSRGGARGRSTSGEALDIGFNITYLLDVTAQSRQPTRSCLALGDANSSALITDARAQRLQICRHADAHLVTGAAVFDPPAALTLSRRRRLNGPQEPRQTRMSQHNTEARRTTATTTIRTASRC